MKPSGRWTLFAIVGVVTVIADQLTKIWARTLPVDARGYGVPVTVIENFWDWRLSFNKGSAFGLFHGMGGARIFLTVVGIAALIAVIFMVKSSRVDQKKLIVGLALVAGGAIGNLIDRIAFGQVTDFVVWKYYDKEWPTFNIADVALVIGVGLMLIDMGKEAKADRAQKKASDEASEKRGRPPAKKKKKRRR